MSLQICSGNENMLQLYGHLQCGVHGYYTFILQELSKIACLNNPSLTFIRSTKSPIEKITQLLYNA